MTGIMLIAVATGGACGALVRYGVMLVMGAGIFDFAGPMATLSGYRNRARAGVLFGIYVRPRAVGASVRVGDAVAPRALPE